jgi:hypothetical protein
MASRNFFRTLRVTVLLVVLFFVGLNTWLTQLRSTDWNDTLWVVIYPVNGDGSPQTQAYIDGLSRDSFQAIETFLAQEAGRYGVGIREPVTMRLAPQVDERPPMPEDGAGTLSVMLWSLKLRYWAWRIDNFDGPRPDVRMFVVYHDPARYTSLRHSLGIQKGMIGVVNAFASKSMAERNNIVIAHEFLHTVGASDKYDMATNLPLYPHGYAEPDRQPLYPQHLAEIMGGRIPLSDDRAVMPESVEVSRVGPETAEEIRWIN